MKHQQLIPIINSEGYLKKFDNWDEEIAILIAESEKILLKKQHWEIIYFTRSLYKKFKISPTIRLLTKTIGVKYGTNKGNSIYLFHLFPKNDIARTIAKISGLPKPKKCL